jgi:sterol desaturase/sphingolipid hydroxylase (fatty acid hydroxylase superfamily)
MLSALVQIALGIIIANLYEWMIHKYILHGMGKKKKSFWSSHWRVHHKKVRQSQYFDEDYLQILKGWNEGTKEVLSLIVLSVIQIPSFLIFPWYSGTMIAMAAAYFLVHRKSHLDPTWAKKWAPWHYDHHMGKHQDANWCVTMPLWDHILRTRKRYTDTEKEVQDTHRKVVKQKILVYNIEHDIIDKVSNDRRPGSVWKNDVVQLDSQTDPACLEHSG